MVGKALDEVESREPKTELDRMAAMLSRLGGSGYNVGEDPGVYGMAEVDFDPDSDSDFDEQESQPDASRGPGTAGAAPGQ